MEEEKTLLNEVASEDYDAADRPFDFVGEGGATALVCEPDPAVREKISDGLKELGYQITTPATAKDALKAMRFHVFDVVVLNELFDTEDPKANDVLPIWKRWPCPRGGDSSLPWSAGDTGRWTTWPPSTGASISSSISRASMTWGRSSSRGVADNRAFYHIFQETLQKMGKV